MRANIPEHYRHLFKTGKSINGFDAMGGNSGRLMADSNAAIDSMVADIDAATNHVHLAFYIWLTDNNGMKMVEALKRAAARGVKCRAMADDLGSRALIRSPHWKEMADAGVHVAVALPIGNPLLKPLRGTTRFEKSPQNPGDRRMRHVLRQSKLCRSRVSGEEKVCAVGGCSDSV